MGLSKKEKINVAAVQMSSVIGDINTNCQKIKKLIDRDIQKDVDIIVLPEVWTVGWACSEFRKCAESLDNSLAIDTLAEIARKHNSFVIGGSIIEKDDTGAFYNTCPVLNRQGELVAKYSKMHLFSYYGDNEGEFVSEGKAPVMVDVEGVKVGLTICFDIRFPEIYRAYRKAGADLFVNCAAWGVHKPIPWECMTRSRATENQTYMIALTQCGQIKDDKWNLGHSRIFDYNGNTISEIVEQKECVISATLNFNEMYDFREKCTILKDIKQSYEVECV